MRMYREIESTTLYNFAKSYHNSKFPLLAIPLDISIQMKNVICDGKKSDRRSVFHLKRLVSKLRFKANLRILGTLIDGWKGGKGR